MSEPDRNPAAKVADRSSTIRVRGLDAIDGTPVVQSIYEELLRSYDEGVAEFLNLERVKPNTLGNTRMLLHLR